jgi:hypothetical protein
MIDPHVPPPVRGPHRILPKMAYRGQGVSWARILAFVTGMVDQELLARIEYLAAEIAS